MYQTHNATTEG